MHDYRVGESEIIDCLDDYWPLHPWNGQTPLVIAVEEWDCRQCKLVQWAKVTLSVAQSGLAENMELRGRVESLATLAPAKLDALDGVHVVDEWLARSGFDDGEDDDRSVWSACSVEQRCSMLMKAFRKWCTRVGIDIDRVKRE
jgi:hypothetical protein